MDLALLFRVLLTIAAIGVLMIVHEGGHYLAARAFGMRVTTFSIGFGPSLFRSTPKGSETEFRVGLLPFFAYVAIAGMNPYEDVDPDDESLFPHKGVFARMVTIGAGPIANYLFASLLVFGVAIVGWPHPVEATRMIVGEVSPGSPAAVGGIRAGDVIVQANGQPVRNVLDVLHVTEPREGQATSYVIEREGRRTTLTITPKRIDGHARIGVAAQQILEYVPQPVTNALRIAIIWPAERVALQLEGIGETIRQATLRNIGGPVRMVKEGAKTAEGGAGTFILFVAFISTGLALFNALPFPMLDGGRLLFLAYEVVTRKRADPKIEAVVHYVGFIFLLALMVVVTFKDLSR